MIPVNKKIALVAAGSVAAIATGTAAYAFWSAAGTGSGAASTATGSSVTVQQHAVSTALVPGGSVALTGTFTNSGAGVGKVTSLTGVVSVTPAGPPASGKPPCTAADYTIEGGLESPVTVPANGTAPWSGLRLTMVDSPTVNQDNCKSAAVTVTYTAN